MRHVAYPAMLLGLVLSIDVPARAQDATGWGTVKGQAVFAGDTVPAPKAADVNKDKAHCLSKGKILQEEWIIDKETKGLGGVFVWLAPAPGSKKLPIHPSLKEPKEKQVTMDQPCCAFVPHLVALRQGQELVVKNSAPVVHNVHWYGWAPYNESGNVIVPSKGSHTISGLKQQRSKANPWLPVSIKCDIHGWMLAYVGVFNHPYFALTDAKGQFEIKDAPAGDWQLIMWHESAGWILGKAGKKVAVKADGVTDVGKVPAKP
jgi:hypothetical protein